MEREEFFQKCSEYFEKREAVTLVLVYGSITGDQFNKNSDLDIAVAGSLTGDDLLVFKRDMELLCGRNVDLLDLQSTEGIILHRILTRGIRIKNDDPGLLAFYLKKALFYMQDFFPLLKAAQNTRIRRFIDGH